MTPGRTLLVLVWAIAGSLAAADAPPPARDSLTDRLGIKYSPPAPATGATAAESAPAVPDKSVLVLPRLHVRDTRISPAGDEFLTPQGRLEEAKRRHLSPMYQKTFGPLSYVAAIYFNPLAVLFGKPNEADAMVLYEQEQSGIRAREEKSLIELGALAEEAARLERQEAAGPRRPASKSDPK